MKKVIITGVTGQDGSHMVDYLLQHTDCVIYGGVRRLSVTNHKNIQHLNLDSHFISSRFKLIDLDISDPQSIENAVNTHKPDYFINFAANSFVGTSWDMPVVHMQSNCMSVLNQLEAIRKLVPNCRYYNAGSSEEFGDVVSVPQNEAHPLRPRSPYGASKAAARHIVKVWRDSYKLFAIQGWLFNHEGVRRGTEFVTRKISRGVADIATSMQKSGKVKPIQLGNLDSKRDWSDAEDFVEGVWMMLNHKEPKEYVLSSNETHTVREFIELAFAAAGIEGQWIGAKGTIDEVFVHKVSKVPLVVINPQFFRPAEVDLLLGDSSLARKELGWTPKTSFFQLVKKMVENDLRILS
jgi:GDPmannose 4,6-dehydratase